MANKEVKKIGFFKGLKSEFTKITWPTRDDLVKETTVVIFCSVLIGLIISVADVLIKYGINLFVK